jgi:hypothetical protein
VPPLDHAGRAIDRDAIARREIDVEVLRPQRLKFETLVLDFVLSEILRDAARRASPQTACTAVSAAPKTEFASNRSEGHYPKGIPGDRRDVRRRGTHNLTEGRDAHRMV